MKQPRLHQPRLQQVRSTSPLKQFVLATGLGLFAALLSAAAVAGEVYQWKDAKGVTQYSSTPPAKGNYKVRTIRHNGATINAVADVKPDENAQCGTLRKNIAVLQTKGALPLDTDGDGKTDKTLSDSERISQLASTQAMLTARCTDSAAAPTVK